MNLSGSLPSPRDKLKALIPAWLESIRLEELSNAKVEPEKAAWDNPNIWEKGFSLVGDLLVMEEPLFKDLKKKHDASQKTGEELQLVLTFPQIYSVERNVRQFRPLLLIEFSSIFKGNYHSQGWDLTKGFEFQAVSPNLMELLNLEEEDLAKLVTGEGIKTFLEETFKVSIKTLQNFIELFVLPEDSNLLFRPSPYLLQFSFTPFNYNLKKDIHDIQNQDDWGWLDPEKPTYQYLFGQPPLPEDKTLFLGAFPGKCPTASQATVLKHIVSNSLTAAQGPPGTGKTALLVQASALPIVERAIHLARTGEDQTSLVVVSSTNNRAVQNFEELLPQSPAEDIFYLPGGSRDRINNKVVPLLQARLSWFRTHEFDPVKHRELSDALLKTVDTIQRQQRQDERDQQEKQKDLDFQRVLSADYQATEQGIDSTKTEITNLEAEFSR